MSGTGHLATAMLGFQADAPPIHLDSTNPHFESKFASLPGVVEAIRPALNKHGLVFMQFPTNLEGAPALETMLIHAETGEDIAAVMPLILSKNDPQGYGSALTYARRYALLSILGLVGDEDDDANTATQPRAADPHGLQASRADAPQTNGAPVSAANTVIHFSKNKGRTLGSLTPRQLEWYAQTWEPNPEYATDEDRKLKEAAQLLHLGADAVVPADDYDSIPF